VYQAQQNSEPHVPLPLAAAYKPPVEAIPKLRSLWRARSTEDLEILLDKAQSIIVRALQSDDFRTQLKAIKVMLKTRQARERGW
jgi:hypothetical protein